MRTVRRLEKEIGIPLDHRRLRANIYADFASGTPFAEDALVRQSVRIGSRVVLSSVARDSSCKMITLDPETGAANPNVAKKARGGSQQHGRRLFCPHR
jgi:uncharacterized protein YcbX